MVGEEGAEPDQIKIVLEYLCSTCIISDKGHEPQGVETETAPRSSEKGKALESIGKDKEPESIEKNKEPECTEKESESESTDPDDVC